MIAIERPSIHPKWAKNWKQICENRKEIFLEHDTANIARLEAYAESGTMPDMVVLDGLSPRYHNWEYLSSGNLALYANFRFWELEMEGINSNNFNLSKAVRAFSAGFTTDMILIYKHCVFPIRNPGRGLARMNLEFSVRFSSLGLVIGCKKEALALARLQVLAYRKAMFNNVSEYPMFEFMLNIMADFINEPMPVQGGFLNLPILMATHELWRDQDPNVLAPLLLAMCDLHTQHSGYKKSKSDFSDFHLLTRTPIEIILIFKLREILGLGNPTIDHPIMNTALGRLPEHVSFKDAALGSDNLIARVRDQMAMDDYDEDKIIDML